MSTADAAPMKIHSIRLLAGIIASAVLVRLALAALAPTPGIADPTHYFNVARSIVDGRGLVIDYIWQYHHPPADVTHPIDYYPPLTALFAATGMFLFGKSVFASLLPSVIFGGVLLPLFAYALCGFFRLSPGGRLFAAGATAFMPEFVLNSVRTDTTIFYVTFAGAALYGIYRSLAEPETQHRARWLAFAGLASGLAYLTRLDGLLLLPVFAAAMLAFGGLKVYRFRAAHLLHFSLPMMLVVLPWLLRNQAVLGTPFPVKLARTIFVTRLHDLFSYGGAFSLESYLEWGIGNIAAKIGFETLGNLKMLIVLLSVLAPIALAGVALLLFRAGTRAYFFLPAALFLLGLGVYYTVFTPFLSQSGSFKKTAMTLLPFAAVLSAWALSAVRGRTAFMVATCAVLGFYGLDLTRADFQQIARYEAHLQNITAAVRRLGDANGDGRIVVFTQDPFQWNYYGFHALMYGNDDYEVFFDVARRYSVDYFVFPADREALNPIQNGEATDPRLQLVWEGRPDEPKLYRYHD